MYRCPTTKSLIQAFGLSKEDATLAHKIMKGEADPMQLEGVRDWVSRCYREPPTVDLVMYALNCILDLYGVEALRHEDEYHDAAYLYCNTGDTYGTTIIFNNKGAGSFFIGCWGDLAERDSSLTSF